MAFLPSINPIFYTIPFICFFLSGLTSLVFELLWTRMLILVFGGTTFAIGALLTSFMGGLALGSYFVGRFVDRIRQDKIILIYGIIELGIGIYALSVPTIFSSLTPLSQWIWLKFEPTFFTFSVIRFLISFFVFLVPTTFMGATLPLLSKSLVNRAEEIGTKVGYLYALNTFGAVAGTILGGFFLMPSIGQLGTNYLASSLNFTIFLLVGAVFLWGKKNLRNGRNSNLSTIPPSFERNWKEGDRYRYRNLLVIILVLNGFATMAYQVIWTRILVLILGSSIYAFTVILSTFLIGLALGTYIFSKIIRRLKEKTLLTLSLIQVSIGLSAYLLSYLFIELPYLATRLLGAIYLFNPSFDFQFFTMYLLASFIILLPTILMGGIFPLIVSIYAKDMDQLGKDVGQVYMSGTIGAILGSFFSSFLLIPLLGLQTSLIVTAIINILVGLILILPQRKRQLLIRVEGIIGFLFLLSLLIYSPSWNPLIMNSGVFRDWMDLYAVSRKEFIQNLKEKYSLLYYREGINSTVAVVRSGDNTILKINGKDDASSRTDLETQVLLGELPILFSNNPQKALVIGYGSGTTVGSILQSPIKKVVAVELEKAVLEASQNFKSVNHDPLKELGKRIEIIEGDGRNYLLLTRERYDIIVSEPSNPWMTGVSNLFTLDFFQKVKDHLTEQGIFSQWMHIYSMSPQNLKSFVATFNKVFPYNFLFLVDRTDIIILGSKEKIEINTKNLEERMRVQGIREDLERVGIKDIYSLLTRFALGYKELPSFALNAPLNTDDNGRLEFHAPKDLFTQTILDNHSEIYHHSRGIIPYLYQEREKSEDKRRFLLNLAEAFKNRWYTSGKEKIAEIDELFAQFYGEEAKRIR